MDLAVTPVADLGAMTMARPSREYLREALAAAFEGVLPVVARVRSGVGEFCHRRAQLSWIVIVGTVVIVIVGVVIGASATSAGSGGLDESAPKMPPGTAVTTRPGERDSAPGTGAPPNPGAPPEPG